MLPLGAECCCLMQVLESSCVVLVRTQGPVNLGLTARACANLGVGALRLVDPLCDRDCDEARKFANHARELLEQATVHPSLADAVADRDCVIGTSGRERDVEFGPVQGTHKLTTLVQGATAPALVFGNEADGLDNDELRECHHVIRLATPGSYPSYNLSHAVAILLYQFAGVSAEPASEETSLATREELARLRNYWLGTLERFNYFRRTPLEQWRPHFEAMLNRWPLSKHDTEVIRGMLSQFNYIQFGDKGHAMADTGRAPDAGDEHE